MTGATDDLLIFEDLGSYLILNFKIITCKMPPVGGCLGKNILYPNIQTARGIPLILLEGAGGNVLVLVRET